MVGSEESLNKFQEFLSSFFNGLIQNHAAGVGGYIEDAVSRAIVVCRNRVRALEIFGSAETNRKPDSEEIENVSVEFLHVFSGAGALAVALYAVVLERGF